MNMTTTIAIDNLYCITYLEAKDIQRFLSSQMHDTMTTDQYRNFRVVSSAFPVQFCMAEPEMGHAGYRNNRKSQIEEGDFGRSLTMIRESLTR